MNSELNYLQPYPFQKIQKLLADTQLPEGITPISLSIGEPKHPTPDFIFQAVKDNLGGLANYPLTKGSVELRAAIGDWLNQRFKLNGCLDPEQHVIPVNGTREAIFSFAQAVIDRHVEQKPVLLSPNPFYQIYEGAAFLAGAEPVFLACTEDNNFSPDFSQVTEDTWQRCQLLYLCSPGNPTGAVMSVEQMQMLIELSQKYNFIIASDECYSELYFDEAEPPVGLLQVAAAMGNTDFKNCIVFHSLSKRSNAPGMRSGFIAGDKDALAKFLQYRTYHGCAMSPPYQAGSIAAWRDEAHVKENRDQYRRKFAAVLDILSPVMDIKAPQAGFYLWPTTPIDDKVFMVELYKQYAVSVVPGSYLAREVDGVNPGQNRIRMALVATEAECIEAAQRIRQFIENLS